MSLLQVSHEVLGALVACFCPLSARVAPREPCGGGPDTSVVIPVTCAGICNWHQSVYLGLTAEADVSSESDTQAGETLTAFPPQGMGGQHHYFGLWIDVDFGKGHSKAKPACTTYNSPQLSAQEDFRFEKMEVWAVGDDSHSKLVSVGRFSTSSASLRWLEGRLWRRFIPHLFPEFAGQRDASGGTAESCQGPLRWGD